MGNYLRCNAVYYQYITCESYQSNYYRRKCYSFYFFPSSIVCFLNSMQMALRVTICSKSTCHQMALSQIKTCAQQNYIIIQQDTIIILLVNCYRNVLCDIELIKYLPYIFPVHIQLGSQVQCMEYHQLPGPEKRRNAVHEDGSLAYTERSLELRHIQVPNFRF